MAQLDLIEQKKLEKLFGMGSGWVLDFNNRSFTDFFQQFSIDIDNSKYMEHGGSKAKRLRAFWKQENNVTVGKVLEKLIDYAEYLAADKDLGLTEADRDLVLDCRNIANRLTGKPSLKESKSSSKSAFLSTDFGEIDFSKLPIESLLCDILEKRLKEAQICLGNGANLAAIFMAGSLLEGLLLGTADTHSEQFNRSPSCPKNKDDKPKRFPDWKLAEFIDVGRELNFLGEDVKKFSHALRDFRNYIHPHAQMTSRFNPDEDTAKICLQVLKAALSDLTKNKPSK